jgi:hypothetical protein
VILQTFNLLELDGEDRGRCRWASANFAWRLGRASKIRAIDLLCGI